MKDLPTVEKPYLTLDEAFNQLKKAGAELNKPEDILVIAENKELNVNLILELSSDIMLIEEKHVRALLKKIPASEYDYDSNVLSDVGFTSEDMNEFREEIEGVDWLVVSNDTSMKVFDAPKAFIPKDVNTEVLKISNSRCWLSDRPKPKNLSALEIDGVNYFIVKDLTDNPLFESVEKTHEMNNCEGIKYCLDKHSIEAIIESNSYVVTREEVLAYEERRRDRIKSIAKTKADRKLRTEIKENTKFRTVDELDLCAKSIAQKTNLLKLGDYEKFFQLFTWKAVLIKRLSYVRNCNTYKFEENRTKDIAAIKSSLSDIEVLLDDKLLVSSDANSSKNNSPEKSGSKPTAKDGVNEARIKNLRIYINELAISAKNNGVEFDPFNLGCSKDMLLSEIKTWEKDRVPTVKDRLWVCESFPIRTWNHPLRKEICDNFMNKNYKADPLFFEKIKRK